MIKEPNNYLKILLYLKQFEGDGEMHEIEHVIGLEHQAKLNIIQELAQEGYINLYGGYNPGGVYFGDGTSFFGEYIKAQGKLTLKGAKYLKEEIEMMDNNKYNINIGNNSTANLIMDSPGSSISNKIQHKEKVDKIIETLQNDLEIDSDVKNNALLLFNNLRTEIETGNLNRNTLNDAVTIGANIASIGSLVLALVQQFMV